MDLSPVVAVADTPKPRWRKYLPWLGLLLLGWLLSRFDLRALGRAFASVSAGAALSALGLFSANILLKSFRWQRMLSAQRLHLPMPVAVAAFLSSQFYGQVTLGRVGELYRAEALIERGVPLGIALSSSVYDRRARSGGGADRGRGLVGAGGRQHAGGVRGSGMHGRAGRARIGGAARGVAGRVAARCLAARDAGCAPRYARLARHVGAAARGPRTADAAGVLGRGVAVDRGQLVRLLRVVVGVGRRHGARSLAHRTHGGRFAWRAQRAACRSRSPGSARAR